MGSAANEKQSKGVANEAAVRVYEGITDDAEAGRLVRESFLPLLDQVQGFIAYLLDRRRRRRDGIPERVRRQGRSRRSVRLAQQWVQENAATLNPNPPQVTEGLVVASETK